MLQELLNLGLVNIGSDDSRFAKMESAAQKLSAQFKDSPSLMITATLVALDEQVHEDDPFFELVEGLVIVGLHADLDLVAQAVSFFECCTRQPQTTRPSAF